MFSGLEYQSACGVRIGRPVSLSMPEAQFK